MRPAIAALLAAAVLLSMAAPAVQAQSSAAGALTLGASGWSDSSVGTWDGTTGTLTTDLTQGIEITASGITLDGNGHTLTGGKAGYGVYALRQTGVTIKNLKVTGFAYGIFLESSSGATLANNVATENVYYGIYLESSGRATLTANAVTSNGSDGILASTADGNKLSGNTVSANGEHGIYLRNCTSSTLTKNVMSDNRYNLRVDGESDAQYSHTIDTTNQVDGKPVYYLVGVTGGTYDASTDAGVVYLINCTGVTLKGLSLSANHVGALLWKTSGSRLEGIQATGNSTGIWLRYSPSNTLDGNGAQRNEFYGIHLESSDGNTLTGNNLERNGTFGLYLAKANGNQVYGNRFVANGTQALDEGGTGNVFNQLPPKGGNYWSDWTSPDDDLDGFVDKPYAFNGVEDKLPLSGLAPVDTTPPKTMALLDGARGEAGWYRSDVQVTLVATDEGGSGVERTKYRLDGGSWTIYTGIFTVSREAASTLDYYSTDHQGNAEAVRSQAIKIDRGAPEITIDTPQPAEVLQPGATLSFAAHDALSGLQGMTGTLSDGASNWPVASGQAVGAAGFYSLSVTAADMAGNTASATRSFVVATAEASAEASKVTGGGWFVASPDAKGAAGKAFLNLTCQTRQLSAVPVGELSFQVGSLKLQSNGYRSLVVRGNQAWLEGTGTINGSGNYLYQVALVDGKADHQPDRVRVRIWEQPNARLVYDSQPGAADGASPTTDLSGGNITVHKG